MYRFFLSWRYMRSRRINLIGIVGIFVAVGALILILSIMTGFLEESRKALRGSLSDLIIEPRRGMLTESGSALNDPQPLLAAIRGFELERGTPRARQPVRAAAAHLVWLGLLLRGDELTLDLISNSMFSQRLAVKLVGIDVEDEFQTTPLRESLTREPRFGALVADPDQPFAPPPGLPQRGRPRPAVVVGEQLFRTHDLRRGQVINIAIPTIASSGAIENSNREFVVAGTFRSRENEIDLERIYLARQELARFVAGVPHAAELPADALRFTEVLVRLEDYARDAPAARAELGPWLEREGRLPPFSKVFTWEEFRAELLGAIKNERALMGIMLSLVLLVAGFTVFAILSMMVTEKRRDIGILTALGAPPRGVLALFLLIGFWDALLGAALGAGAGTWMALEIDGIERWLSATFGYEIFDRNVYLFDHIPSVIEPLRVALIVLGAFACALAFAAIPAWKAATLDPLDALRYE